MKKLVSLILALAMILSFCVIYASAVEEPEYDLLIRVNLTSYKFKNGTWNTSPPSGVSATKDGDTVKLVLDNANVTWIDSKRDLEITFKGTNIIYEAQPSGKGVGSVSNKALSAINSLVLDFTEGSSTYIGTPGGNVRNAYPIINFAIDAYSLTVKGSGTVNASAASGIFSINDEYGNANTGNADFTDFSGTMNCTYYGNAAIYARGKLYIDGGTYNLKSYGGNGLYGEQGVSIKNTTIDAEVISFGLSVGKNELQIENSTINISPIDPTQPINTGINVNDDATIVNIKDSEVTILNTKAGIATPKEVIFDNSYVHMGFNQDGLVTAVKARNAITLKDSSILEDGSGIYQDSAARPHYYIAKNANVTDKSNIPLEVTIVPSPVFKEEDDMEIDIEEDAVFSINTNLNAWYGDELELVSAVLVDGNKLNKDDYTLAKGSTIVTLSSAFLETLKTGKHTLRVEYGTAAVPAEITFTVNNPALDNKDSTPTPAPSSTSTDNEKVADTADGTQIIAAVSLMCSSALGVYTSRKRRIED